VTILASIPDKVSKSYLLFRANGRCSNYARLCRCPSITVILFDRDAKFGKEVVEFLKASDLKPMRTSVPGKTALLNDGWAVLATRCLIIPLNERHFRRLGGEIT
jgi:hypothetical protein